MKSIRENQICRRILALVLRSAAIDTQINVLLVLTLLTTNAANKTTQTIVRIEIRFSH